MIMMNEEIQSYWKKCGFLTIKSGTGFFIYQDFLMIVAKIKDNNILYYKYDFKKDRIIGSSYNEVSEQEMLSFVRLQAFL